MARDPDAVAANGLDPSTVLDSLGSAVAVVDRCRGTVLLENRAFGRWFPDGRADGNTIRARMGALDGHPGFPAGAANGAGPGRPCSFEATVPFEGRPRPVHVEIRAMAAEGMELLVVECTDISRHREIQAIMEVASEMTERSYADLHKRASNVEAFAAGMVPEAIFREWMELGAVAPRRFDNATVMFLDFVGFTEMELAADAIMTVMHLNDLFSTFDQIAESQNCRRIKTVGDGYMAACGIVEPDSGHARNVAHMALRIRDYLHARNRSHTHRWECRIGIGSGPCIGAVIGTGNFSWDVFGPAVNLAARVEGVSGPMEITVSEGTRELLGTGFSCEDCGVHDLKGFGRQRLYRLLK